MKRIFVGIDISKGWLDYAVCDGQASPLVKPARVDNDVKGIASMLSALCKSYSRQDLWFCFEHTGNYGLLLASILQSKSLDYSMVPALEVKKSLGITRGKSDQIDAKRLAEYAACHMHKLKLTSLPSDDLIKIKNLLAYRAQLTKARSGFTNSLKAYKKVDKVVDMGFVTKDLENRTKELKQSISRIDNQIVKIINESDELLKNYKLISSVKGIGLVIAAFMLVYTHNFTTFDDPRKFNCFAGLAPFESSSGIKQNKTRTSHYRHKYLKALLFNGAHSAAMYDPQIKQYYRRKIEEGKAHLSVINAIACKLVSRVFATVKRQTPYVILMH
jgi:transposase